MTLAVTAPPPLTPPATVRVCTLVLSDRTLEGLPEALQAVAAQTLAPDRVVVLDRTDGARVGDAQGFFTDSIDVQVRVIGGVGLRRAVAEAASQIEEPGWLLWVLPVGATPDPDALSRLLDAHRTSPSVGLVGPKLLDARDPRRVRSAGFQMTVTGRLIDDPAAGAVDQQQFDERSDVISVPVIGALVDAGLARDLGGWDETFGDLGSDLDFGWRAQRAESRVLVVPRARVRVAPGIGLATGVDGGRRRAARRVALRRCSWWAEPFLALWLAMSAVVGGLALLLAKRPRAAWQEFADLGALEPVRLVRARLRRRGPATVRRRDLRALFVSGADVRGRLADGIHDALFPSRQRSDDAPVETRRSSASRMLTHPGLLVGVAALGATVVAARSLGTGTLTSLGGGLQGGELLGGRISSTALWHAWTDGWQGDGLGAPAVTGAPHLGLLAAATWVVEHLPGAGSLSSPGGFVVAVLLLLSPMLGAVVAYLAGRVVTSDRWPRAFAALLWGLSGPSVAAVSQGRVGPMVAQILCPALGAGLVLLARRDGTATAAWATALVIALVGAFAPVLLIPVGLLTLLLVVGAPTGAARLRALVPLVGPALLGPWWLAVAADPRVALAGPGGTSWGGLSASVVDLLRSAAGPGAWSFWAFAPVALVALVGLARGGRVRSLPTGAALLGLLGLVTTIASPRIHLALSPDLSASTPGSMSTVTPWPGLGMFLVVLSLLALALRALGTAPVGAAERSDDAPTLSAAGGPGPATAAHEPASPVTARLRGVGVLLLAAAAVAGAVVAGHDTLGHQLTGWRDTRPAVAVEHAQGDIAGRTLRLIPGDGGMAYRIEAREVLDVARALPPDRAEDAGLAPTIATLVDGSAPSAPTLSAAAIGVVGLPVSAEATIRRALDSTEGLTRLVAKDGWDYWRIAAPGTGEHRPVAPPRLTLQTGEDTTVVTTTGQHAATETTLASAAASSLVVAEPSAWAQAARVQLDDADLANEGGSGRPTYAIPAGEHRLTISLDDSLGSWRRIQLLAAGFVVFLAIPFGSRASRRRA